MHVIAPSLSPTPCAAAAIATEKRGKKKEHITWGHQSMPANPLAFCRTTWWERE